MKETLKAFKEMVRKIRKAGGLLTKLQGYISTLMARNILQEALEIS